MSQEPSIALFSGYYPSHGGGIEIVAGSLAEGLARRGYRVSWCALDDGCAHDGPVVRRPFAGTDIAYRLTGTPMPLPGHGAFGRIWRAVDEAEVVIIAEANFLTNAIAFAAAKLKGRPVLLAQHLGLPSTASPFARLLTHLSERCVARPMLRLADRVIYVSSIVHDYFRSVETSSEPLVIGHGVDTSLFRPPISAEERKRERRAFGFSPESRIACFVGRCTISKGVQVVAEMARRRPDWTFVIAGSGPIDPAEWSLPNVRVLGHVEPSRLAALYRASDLFLLPSQSESFSLVVREALACGTCVVCGDTILLTDPNLKRFVRGIRVDLGQTVTTALTFAEALDAPLAPAAGGAAYVAQHCSWDSVVSRYAEAIDELAGSRRNAKLAVAA